MTIKNRTKKISIDVGFPKEILADSRIAREVGILKCIQCGRCTASCPAASIYDDFSPRDMMLKLNTGQFNELLMGDAIWRCGQCYTCHSRCPRGNSPAKIILALREISINKGLCGSRATTINSSIVANFLEKGETMSPDMIGHSFLENYGPEVQELWKKMPQLRGKMGYDARHGRREKIPQRALAEIRMLLEMVGFPKTRR